MKFFKLFLVLSFIMSGNISASEHCKLLSKSERLQKLDSALIALQKSIDLPPECEDQQQELINKAKELQNTVQSNGAQLYEQTGNTSGTLSEQQLQALNIGTTLTQSINSITNKCRTKSLGLKDYVHNFFDVLNGLAPIYLLTGGEKAVEYVFGTTIIGETVKAIIDFFTGNDIDLNDDAQRNAFISHSCEFRRLWTNQKAVIDELDDAFLTDIKGQIKEKEEEIKSLQKSDSESEQLLQELLEKKKAIAELRKSFKEYSAELAEAGESLINKTDKEFEDIYYGVTTLEIFLLEDNHKKIIETYLANKPSKVVSRLAKEMLEKISNYGGERDYYLDLIDGSIQLTGFEFKGTKTIMDRVLAFNRSLERMISGLEKQNEDNIGKVSKKSKIVKLKLEIEQLKSRQKIVTDLKKSVTNTMLSEIDIHGRGIMDSLFGVRENKQGIWKDYDSPVDAYISLRVKDSFDRLDSFEKAYENFLERIRENTLIMINNDKDVVKKEKSEKYNYWKKIKKDSKYSKEAVEEARQAYKSSKKELKFIEETEDKVEKMDNLDDLFDYFNVDRVRENDKKDMCSALEHMKIDHFYAQTHINSAFDYCVLFSDIVNANAYPYLRDKCFDGLNDVIDPKTEEAYQGGNVQRYIKSVFSTEVRKVKKMVKDREVQLEQVKRIMSKKDLLNCSK